MKIKSMLTFLIACAATGSLFGQENYSNWRAARSITINTSPSGANVSSRISAFPLLVRLSREHEDVFANSKSNGTDIRFTTGDGTSRLYHQIERWDKAARIAEIWVLVDTVEALGLTTIRMLWNNPAAADSSSGSKVFSTANGYVGVWHMGVSPAHYQRKNSVANSNHAVPTGSSGQISISTTEGRIGLADSLRGNGRGQFFHGDHFDLGSDFSALGDNGAITLSAWVKPSTTGYRRSFVSLGNSSSTNVVRIGSANGGKATGQSITTSGTGTTLEGPANSLTPEAWQHVAYTIRNTGTKDSLYLNGVLIANGTAAQGVSDVYRSANYIGRSSWSTDTTYQGVIDEVVVSNLARSADWIRLSYETQKSSPNAVTIGVSESEVFMTAPVAVHEDFPNVVTPTARLHPNAGLDLKKIETVGPYNAFTGSYGAGSLRVGWSNNDGPSYGMTVHPFNGVHIGIFRDSVGGQHETGPVLNEFGITTPLLSTDEISSGTLSLHGANTYDGSSGATWNSQLNMDHYNGIRTEKTDIAYGYVFESSLSPERFKLGWDNADYPMGGSYGIEATPFEFAVKHYWDSLGGTFNTATIMDPFSLSTGLITADIVNVNSLNATTVVTSPKWQSVPDYVFDPNYRRRSLSEVEAFVKKNRHLPEIPSAREIADKGLDLTDMNLKLLKTVEEMTLHLIALEKGLSEQKSRNDRLEARVKALDAKGGKP